VPIEHGFAQTNSKITDLDLIRSLYRVAPKEYITILTMEESIRRNALELEILKKAWVIY